MSKVTIITATTGTNYLEQNIDSVASQTYKNIQHLIVVDGEHNYKKAKKYISNNNDVLVLPYATGIDQYNGHRIYGGCTYFAKNDFIIYLDEDNWIDPNHVESLIDCVGDGWACSLRKITDMDGNFICNDDCESLGNWESIIGDFFVDVNCFFLPKRLALQLTPLWYRRARHPNEQPEVDRILTYTLKHNKIKCTVSGEYTVNYRAGNRADSVQSNFFILGNKKMLMKYNNILPWKKYE